jgi:ABC-type multidrug transport system fused ATPase/permease subunit
MKDGRAMEFDTPANLLRNDKSLFSELVQNGMMIKNSQRV